MKLTIDDIIKAKSEDNVSEKALENALDGIDGDTSCFVVLTEESGSYLQCAGRPDNLTVEFREVQGDAFKHYVLGEGENKSPMKVTWCPIECRIGSIMVHDDEVFTGDKAKSVMKAYLNSGQLSTDLRKRNVTKMFKNTAHNKELS